MGSTNTKPFDAQAFLDSAGVARAMVAYRRCETLFSQGDAANSLFYLQKGRVQLSAVSKAGREAIVATFGPGDFVGEGCLAGRSVRLGTATAMIATNALTIDKDEMFRVLHAEHALSDRFIQYMLGRNIRIEEDLIGHLFNSCEKRLARTLLLLARYGQEDRPEGVLPKQSQATLAGMAGTTRARANGFMSKFRRLGFIEDAPEGLKINNSLLNVVLHD